eukprot:11224312-Lingulodinium_polyedra.AAC.1
MAILCAFSNMHTPETRIVETPTPVFDECCAFLGPQTGAVPFWVKTGGKRSTAKVETSRTPLATLTTQMEH